MRLKYLFGLEFYVDCEDFIKYLNASDPNVDSNLISVDFAAFHINSSRKGKISAREYEMTIGYLGRDVKFLLMSLSHELLENSGLISAESIVEGSGWLMKYSFMSGSKIAMTYEYKEGITEIKLFGQDLMQRLEEMVMRHRNERINENKNRLEL